MSSVEIATKHLLSVSRDYSLLFKKHYLPSQLSNLDEQYRFGLSNILVTDHGQFSAQNDLYRATKAAKFQKHCRRSFSSSTKTHKPNLLRTQRSLPPPLPPSQRRPPGGPPPPRSGDDEEDIAVSFAPTDSERIAQRKQQERQDEESKKVELQRRKRFKEVKDKCNELIKKVDLFNGGNKVVVSGFVKQELWNARNEALAHINRVRRKLERQIEAWQSQVEGSASVLEDFYHLEIDRRLRDAQILGKQDWKNHTMWWDYYQKVLQKTIDQVEELVRNVKHLQKKYLKLDNSIKMQKWYEMKIMKQAEWAIWMDDNLKDNDKGLQKPLRDASIDLYTKTELLINELRHYESDLLEAYKPDILKNKQPSIRYITSAWQVSKALIHLKHKTMKTAHYWRHWSYFRSLADISHTAMSCRIPPSRFQVVVERLQVNIDELYCISYEFEQLNRWKIFVKKWSDSVSDVQHDTEIKLESTRKLLHKRALESAEQLLQLTEPLYRPESLDLGRSAIKDPVDRSVHFIMSPFALYISSLRIAATLGFQLFEGLQEKFDLATIPLVYKHIKDILDIFYYRDMRVMLRHITVLEISTSAKLHLNPVLTPEEDYEFGRKRSEERKEAMALARLSHNHTMYGSTETRDRSIDITSMVRDNSLYPETKRISLDYVNSVKRAAQLLEALRQDSVLGLDILSPPSGSSFRRSLIAIASVDRVVIFDRHAYPDVWRHSNPLARFFGDPEALKITYSKPTTLHLLQASGIPEVNGLVGVGNGLLESTLKESRSRTHLRPVFSTARNELLKVYGTNALIKLVKEDLPSALHNLAIRPLYNLYTFLDAAKGSYLEGLAEPVVEAITQAQELMLATNEPGKSHPITIGPVTWDQLSDKYRAEAIIHKALEIYGNGANMRPSRLSLAKVARSIAQTQLRRAPKRQKLSKTSSDSKVIDSLAAYHLFTTFGEELTSINRMLDLRDASESILWITNELSLRLHERHLLLLERYSKGTINRLNYKKPVTFQPYTPSVQDDIETDQESDSDIDEDEVSDLELGSSRGFKGDLDIPEAEFED